MKYKLRVVVSAIDGGTIVWTGRAQDHTVTRSRDKTVGPSWLPVGRGEEHAMRLLVSVSSAADARAALQGGADLIDAKNPARGALGAVPVGALRAIYAEVALRRPVTAALGDATGETAIARAAARYAAAGAVLVKIGFAGVASVRRAAALAAAAVEGARTGSGGRAGLVAVAYADADARQTVAPAALVELAARAGAKGLLLDTINKRGPGLRALMAPGPLAAWVAAAHDAGLLAAVAGRLTADDLAFARDAGTDVAGVRGAACEGGRSGTVVAHKVRQLKDCCAPPATRHLGHPRHTDERAAGSPGGDLPAQR